MDAICKEVSDRGIEKALERVPKDMDATYERILNTINEKSQAQYNLARRILIWIAYARTPLSIGDLAYAISVEMDAKSQEDLESSIPSEESILDACTNLISVDQSRDRYVRFIHFSVLEFLTSQRSTTLDMGFEMGHREIAQACMIFQTLFSDPSMTRNPQLYWYTFDAWPHHLLAGNINSLLVDDKLLTLTSSFFEKGPVLRTKQFKYLGAEEMQKSYLKFSHPVLALIFDLPHIQKCRSLCGRQLENEQSKAVDDSNLDYLVISDDKLAVHYVIAELDSVSITQRLHNNGYTLNYSDPVEKDYASNWLQVSALYSVQSTQMARFLLDNDINIEPQGLGREFCDPLAHFAGRENRVEVFRLLLDRVVGQGGASTGRLEHALSAAIKADCLEAVRLLIDKGADCDNISFPVADSDFLKEHTNAVRAAAWMGKITVLRLLMDKGVDMTQAGHYGDALQIAAYKGQTQIVRLLLDNRAGVDARDRRTGNAFLAAIRSGRAEIVQLLLDSGANVSAQGCHSNALQDAAYAGSVYIIQLLLDNGADVHAQGGYYGNALQAAAYGGEVAAMQLLLDNGADVNAQGGYYGNAMQAAAATYRYPYNTEAIQLLLDKGANINAQGGKHGNALQAAVYSGKVEVIQLLLDNGADINAQGVEYGNALQAAVNCGKIEVIRLLLDKGASISAQGDVYGSALLYGSALHAVAAAYGDNVKFILLLLDQGADINAQGGKFGCALQAAAYVGRVKVIQLLLDKGADINAQGGVFGCALQAAACSGRVEAIQLLLDKGANVHNQGGKYGNALQAAAHLGRVEAVQLLLDKGAGVSAHGGYYGNAMQAAVVASGYSQHTEAIRLLLDKGANVNAHGGIYGNALQAAAYYGHIAVIRLLLDEGANVNAHGGIYGNALQAVVCVELRSPYYQTRGLGMTPDKGVNGDAIRLLLDKGAKVNAQGGIYGNALQAAAHSGDMEVIRLLLDKGADVNTQGGMFGTVLQAAAHSGNVEVIQLLLDRGADIYARGGKYGAALKKMLALTPEVADLKVPGDASLLVELLKDHAPIVMSDLPESKYEEIETEYAVGDRCNLDLFRELLESRGWKREVQDRQEEEPDRLELETKQELLKLKDEYKGENKDANEDSTAEGNVPGGGTSQELQQNLPKVSNESSLGASVHAWKLFGFTFLVVLLYTFIEFFWA